MTASATDTRNWIARLLHPAVTLDKAGLVDEILCSADRVKDRADAAADSYLRDGRRVPHTLRRRAKDKADRLEQLAAAVSDGQVTPDVGLSQWLEIAPQKRPVQLVDTNN